jgi:hypothetical protein
VRTVIKKKINYKPVSRILYPDPQDREAIIYLVWPLLTKSFCLPTQRTLTGFERAALQRWYTWHFSMQGLPAPPVTRQSRGPLPHVFTITLPTRRSGLSRPKVGRRLLFSVALSVPSRYIGKDPALHRYIALCCPDFPPISRQVGRKAIARFVVKCKGNELPWGRPCYLTH